MSRPFISGARSWQRIHITITLTLRDTLGGVAIVLALVAPAASYWPARHALAVDLIVALRND